MKAIIETGGKQISLKENSIIYIEKLDNKEGEEVTFDKVIFDGTNYGNPYIKGSFVKGIIEKHGKMPKIKVIRYLAKSNLHKKYGHRQPYTRVKITQIHCAK